ncbi:MAG: hypothetical protein RL744_629 [Pseudomonadota bacterium]|jgi:SAM-dependent methyltransferase
MNKYLCRVCDGALFTKPLLQYSNSPKSAQGFLTKLGEDDDSVNLTIYQCSKCGLVQHNLLPVPYFKEVIRAVAFSPEMGNFRQQQLHDWISKNHLQSKKILEVGCGKGEYLDLLKKAGATQLAGIEYSEKNVESALGAGNRVFKGYLDSSFKTSSDFLFDAFAIFSFLEHWPNPNEGLGILHSALTDGAVGLVEVPNFDLIIEKGLYSEFTTDHIFYFDKKSFSFLLEKNGFEVISIKSIWYDYILSAEVRKKSPLDVSNFLKIQLSIKNQLNTFINQFSDKSVAIWGAGHQALAVIAMAGVASSIKYVIDSAPFKQGKYTPATHLPINSPESLLVDPPQAIIVMAAGYSNEIVGTLKKSYPHIANIAILREDRLEITE